MFDLTRREWLVQSLSLTGAAFAAQLPPGFATPATPPCDPSTKPTPARKPAAVESGSPGPRLTLEGAVIGIRCGLISGASVTASIGGARAAATTDAGGGYRLSLVIPKTSAAARVNLRVNVPKKTTLTTYLFLPDEIARTENAKAPGFDPLLRMKLVTHTADAIQARFDVILDL